MRDFSFSNHNRPKFWFGDVVLGPPNKSRLVTIVGMRWEPGKGFSHPEKRGWWYYFVPKCKQDGSWAHNRSFSLACPQCKAPWHERLGCDRCGLSPQDWLDDYPYEQYYSDQTN